MHRAGTEHNASAIDLRRRVCYALALALVAYFLTSVAGFYQRPYGFTAFIGFADRHDQEVPALQDVPHAHVRGGYDGQFYAQLALVPLLQDKAIDDALDNAPYRARRILFSWTAYLIGFGNPRWILQVYALQNVVCWLLLAWLLLRWIPPNTPRRLALWSACLFGQGLLASVRLALIDGPSMLLLACAVAVAERNRVWGTAAIVGVSALGRETNLFGLTLLPPAITRRRWIGLAVAALMTLIPLLLWQDYLYSIYRHRIFMDQSLLSVPLSAYVEKWDAVIVGLRRYGIGRPYLLTFLATLGLTTQSVFLLASFRKHRHSTWWRLALPYVALMYALSAAVWEGHPGAAVRVLLPMTFAFNILLNQDSPRAFWAWYALGNGALGYAPFVLRAP